VPGRQGPVGARRPSDGEQAGMEWTVATSWVLAGGSMKTLARSAASAGEGVVDFCGFDGSAVAGLYYTQALALAHPELKVVIVDKEKPECYRFGGGTALARRQASAEMMWFGQKKFVKWDVVPGVLPLLLGREFGSKMRAMVDVAKGDVWAYQSGQHHLVAQSQAQGLMMMSLLGDVQTTGYKHALVNVLTASKVKPGDDAELDTDVDSEQEASAMATAEASGQATADRDGDADRKLGSGPAARAGEAEWQAPRRRFRPGAGRCHVGPQGRADTIKGNTDRNSFKSLDEAGTSVDVSQDGAPGAGDDNYKEEVGALADAARTATGPVASR